MGVTRAPVAGSGSAPAWTRRVSRPHASFVMDRILCGRSDGVRANVRASRRIRQLRFGVMALPNRYLAAIAVFALVLGACVVAPPPAPAQFTDRQSDPVV